MALIRCPKCRKEMADTGDTCPHCGYHFPTTPVATVEVADGVLEDTERRRSPASGTNMSERKIHHRWDRLCFFVPPFGLGFFIYLLLGHDSRWKNTLWSCLLGAAFYAFSIYIILGFFGY